MNIYRTRITQITIKNKNCGDDLQFGIENMKVSIKNPSASTKNIKARHDDFQHLSAPKPRFDDPNQRKV